MQKKKIVVISLIVLTLVFISILAINHNSESSCTNEINGIRYAMKLDGNSISSVPSKGMYRVDVECENAKCYWDYDAWELKIKNIKGDVKCGINFVSLTRTNLNDYILSLGGTAQGNGKVVSEVAEVPDYSTASAISEASYTNQSVFSITYSDDIGETEASGVYSYSDDKWTSDATAMTSATYYYYFKFTPSESGYYQMCYELSNGETNNYLGAYVGSSYISSAHASPNVSKAGCIELGYVSKDSYIKISHFAYGTMSRKL